MGRRLFVPEVVQTSAMDCGPACLSALLAGFGVSASYGRLREACQTDVDGTSIDTLEAIAAQLGLDAQQILIPVDHVPLAEADALPAIAVTRLAERSTHFVVVWGQTLGRFQVMDPSVGRRWVNRQRFLDELYVHEMDLPVEVWREWAGSDDFCRPLGRRLQALGIADAERHIERALGDPSWESIAGLDAATRMVQAIVDARGLALGSEVRQVLETLLADARSAVDAIPPAFWSARPGATSDVVRARGAVLVRVGGKLADAPPPDSAELAAALSEPPARPWRALRAAVAAEGGPRLTLIAIAALVTAAGAVGEALLFRGLFDVGRELTTPLQLLGAVAALVGILLALALIEIPLSAEVQRLGRNVELRLRIAFLAKLPRLGIAYLRSRPISDMAERSHVLHNLRRLPTLGARLARVMLEIVFTAVALALLAPELTLLVLALTAAVLGLPFAAHRAMVERDLRQRTHAGGLARFYLDALLGVVPARTHGFARALRTQHENVLLQWVRAARARLRLDVGVATLQAVLSFGLAIAIVSAHAAREADPAGVLLLAYWALALPLAGNALTGLLREVPTQRNQTLRLLEPLGALQEEDPAVSPHASGAVTLEARAVSVVVAGHEILRDLTLSIAAGEHVAIVGRSGAGKSTLFGLLLGWVRPSAGTLWIDGRLADRSAVVGLRERIAWLDPAVHLWNDTIAANLAYGNDHQRIGDVIVDADLQPVLGRLPMGLATMLGEGGGAISSGEGQRVRFGRALARSRPALVLLDEPFRGLDHEQRRSRLAAARAHWREATLLCITHDLAETATFDRVIVIEDGRVVEDGSPARLLQSSSRYSSLVAEEAHAHEAWRRWRRVVLADGRIQ